MRHKYLSQPHGLEVNAYNDGLHFAYNKDNLPEVLNGEFFEKRNGQRFLELPQRNEPPKGLLQGTTFRLSIALALSLSLAIVLAALTATMTIKLREVERQPAICKISNATTHIPTSNCTDLTTPYSSILGYRYNLHCNTSQPNADLVSIFVYTFKDCIHACASYAHMGTHPGSTCLGVTYSYMVRPGTVADNYDAGSCALKAVGYNETASFQAFGADSAFLVAGWKLQ
ncbi:hypothetical protein N7G274_010899 [Stereocaulon virgatum]|uniref:Uncharacterized protein n=1 Tax=Stereocaulon virgatum TaxID=373712 RepID=A0ABR3ZU83_9LECA